ncbi:E3 binding domain-containing protein, partial [Klebsiella pneumoniae]|nr:E3 binding domain-containing protein [Klebsiella pneumoniae]
QAPVAQTTQAAPQAAPQPSAPQKPAPRASKSVKDLATKLGVDLNEVQGSGKGGRILLQDVEQYAATRTASGKPIDAEQRAAA